MFIAASCRMVCASCSLISASWVNSQKIEPTQSWLLSLSRFIITCEVPQDESKDFAHLSLTCPSMSVMNINKFFVRSLQNLATSPIFKF